MVLCCYDTQHFHSNFIVNPRCSGPPVMSSRGRHKHPHHRCHLSQCGCTPPQRQQCWIWRGGLVAKQQALLFTQMAGEMTHPTPGNTVPQSWDQHELGSSGPWMEGQKRYAVSSPQLHSPHRVSSDSDCEERMTLWGFMSSVFLCLCLC